MKRIPSGLLFWLKVAVSLGLLSLLALRMDLGQLLRVLGSARFSYVAVVLAAYLLSQLLSSLRWLLLARPLGFKLPFGEFLSFYFIGMFFNLFAPSTIGGDVGRVFYLARDGGLKGEKSAFTAYAAISVLSDRAIGMAVLIWTGAAALLLYPGYSLPPVVRSATYAIALTVLAALAGAPLLGRLLKQEADPFRNCARRALQLYARNWGPLAGAFALSAAVHLLQGGLQRLLAQALGLDLPWSFCFILYPLVGTFSALPVSLNGIGLREGGYLFLLGTIGIESEKAVAFSLLWFVIGILASLVGGLVFILRKGPRPSPAPSLEGQIR